MAVTLRDVALYAGVSPRTVSNVVNDFALVSDAMRKRVQKAIDELGYEPNLAARNLRQGRSGLLMLAVPELGNPYFSELSDLIIPEARRHGYNVIVEQTDGDEARELQLLERISRSHFVDGVLFTPVALSEDELRGYLGEVPVVLLGEHLDVGPHDHVGIDNVAAARVAVEHLISLGRTRIAAIGDQVEPTHEMARYRTRGYLDALEAAGYALDHDLVAQAVSFHRRSGAEAMSRFLELAEPPDAVFCYNDLLAIGAIHALLERGLRVPQDVAVVGFDDIEEGRYCTPTLTTISPDKGTIAVAAVGRLLERLHGDDAPPGTQQVDFRLVVRQSTMEGAVSSDGVR